MTEGYRESVPVLTFPRQTFVSLLVFALAWETLSHLAPYLGIPPFAIPSFVRIAKSVATITPIDIVVTLARVIAALIVSFLLGVAMAMACTRGSASAASRLLLKVKPFSAAKSRTLSGS